MLSVVALLALQVLGAFAQLSIWPFPQIVTNGSHTLGVSPSTFQIVTHSHSSLLATAIDRYEEQYYFPFTVTGRTHSPQVSTLTVRVSSTNEELQLGVDESYTLNVGTDGVATIDAVTVFGAMRALETFGQLIDWDETTGVYTISNAPIYVHDYPRFPWRGLLLDSARHYITKNTILRAIRAMAYSKFNTLHWHVIDAQSFPIQSTTYPLLSEKGAYSPRAVFTPADVQEIITYARSWGIRVVAEFDIPGHCYSWGKAYPDIITQCPIYSSNLNNVPLNPADPQTLPILDGLIREMASRFPDKYLHLGGDEILQDCWLEDERVVAWMQANNIPDGIAIEKYFENNFFQIMRQVGKTQIAWQEIFQDNITFPAGTLIEVWKDAATLQQVIDAGYEGLVAYPYYLDKQRPPSLYSTATHYEWVDTWKDFYGADPLRTLVGSNLDKVIGGEACMWAEQVDSVNWDSRVWPRATAVAERLWSAALVNDSTAALPRLVDFRCELAQRGIGAGPVAPDYCPLPFAL